MENKYYTPEISEFHVGFEFEYEVDELNSDEPGWKKSILNFDFGWLEIPQDFALNKRVKYLDQSDIEELGFTYKGKAIDIWFEKEGNFDMGTWTSYKCQLHYGIHDNRLFIDMIDIGSEVRVFNGIIKNKSELKKVLQMLNIK